MDSIQQIGFTNTITAANAHNVFCKPKFLLVIIFKLKNRYGLYEKTQVKGLWLKVKGIRFKDDEDTRAQVKFPDTRYR